MIHKLSRRAEQDDSPSEPTAESRDLLFTHRLSQESKWPQFGAIAHIGCGPPEINVSNETLSKHLQNYIMDMESDWERELEPEEVPDHEKLQKLTKAIAVYFLRSREMIVGDTFHAFEEIIVKAPETVSTLLDEHYTKTILAELPAYVERTLELSAMQAVGKASPTTNTYLREATRTYVLGLPQACVALSRAALEQSLKEVLGYQLSGAYIKFQNLLDDAAKWKVLDKHTAKMARDLANKGDTVLHEQPTNLAAARDVLVGVRGLVQQVYSSRGDY